MTPPFDADSFTADAAALVAANDRVPAQRTGDLLDWEQGVLARFLQKIPATGEAPDYIHALAMAMLDLRAEQRQRSA